VVLADLRVLWIFVGEVKVIEMSRPLKALNAALLMLARRLRRFLRLSLEKPLTLSLMPLP